MTICLEICTSFMSLDCTEDIQSSMFSVATPNVWKSLPIDIRNTDSLSTYRNKLKTNFFTAA